MICDVCKEAADWLGVRGPKARQIASELHSECYGCDCQHKVDVQLRNTPETIHADTVDKDRVRQ